MNIDVFVSHHTKSSLHIVEGIVNKLEANGIRCWYAPRDTEGAYASSIARALNSCAVFLLILNRPASESVHVLNEIDMVCKRLTRNEDVKIIPFHVADEEIGEDAQYYLGRLHWIDAMTPPMYQRIDELVSHISHLLGKETPNEETKRDEKGTSYHLVSQLPQAREVFDGRDYLMEQIHQLFGEGKRALFLEGIGGIGKSELAKQYALRYQKEYENILFITYTAGIMKLVCDSGSIIIDNLEQEKDEEEQDFFMRKLKVLQTITNEKTLIIVDNFDVDEDPDLDALLSGSYRLIFTTRNAHPGYPTIKVEAIKDRDVLMSIFEKNYGDSLQEEDKTYIEEIFRQIEYHTYTIELIAKQMEASFLSAKEMLELLQKGQLQNSLSETVAGRKDRKTAFGHICSVFNTSNLSEEEKKLMVYLSLMGTQGVLASRFRQWAELSDFELVNGLVRKSWIRKEKGQRISLHPLVKEVVYDTLCPTVENCHRFLEKITEFCYQAWFRAYTENVAVANNILAIQDYFKSEADKDLETFEPYCNLLWQVGKFEESIYYAHILYDTCVKKYGLNSMETGFAAKSLGGCYFNSGHLKESIPWYRQGLDSMLKSKKPESEDLAMSYEKVARCYTWEYEQDFQKAEELFKMALEIRIRLRDALKNGEERTMLMPLEYYGLKKAEIRIGESYMEMGRMYQMKGDYGQALSYSQKQEEILNKFSPEDASSVAYSLYDQGVSLYHLGKELSEQGQTKDAMEKWEQAVEKLDSALQSNLKMRGDLAIDTIDNQEYLADVYAAMGRLGDASNNYMAVITMTEKLMGKDCRRIQAVKEKMNFRQ